MSALSRMIAWVEKMEYRVSRECCYDEMEEKGYASQGRCCGLMGGDNWSDNTMYMPPKKQPRYHGGKPIRRGGS